MNGPILITGTQRSGTTITEEVLNGHPHGYITHELDLTHVLRSINGATFHPRHTSRKVLPFKGDYEEIVKKLYEGSTQKDLGFYGDKLPEYIRDYETLLRFLPSARFIFCTRDPINVASSMKKRNQDARTGQDRGWEELSLDDMCERWIDSHEKALELKTASADKILIVNYEEQVEDPVKIYKHVADFISTPNLFDVSGIKPTNARNFLSQSEMNYIKEKIKDVAKEFNYDV